MFLGTFFLFACLFLGQGTVIKGVSTEGTLLEFDAEGNLRMITHDKAATSAVTYATIGWTVKNENRPISEAEFSVRLKLEQTGEEADSENPAYVYTHFVCQKDVIFQRMKEVSASWTDTLYRNGGIVYLDAIMTVVQNGRPCGGIDEAGNIWGEVYFDYDGIAGARNWSSKQGLKTHFNQAVNFPANPQLLEGTYDIHYMEMRQEGDYENGWNLSRLKKDGSGTFRKTGVKDTAADLSNLYLDYYGAKIICKNAAGEQSVFYETQKTIEVLNQASEYTKIQIYYYYLRKDQTKQIKINGRTPQEMVNAGTFSIEAEGEWPFQVSEGIPSGELIRAKGSIQLYSIHAIYEEHYGYETVPVQVSERYVLKWSDSAGIQEEIVTRERAYYVDKPYQYYTIVDYAVTQLQKVDAESSLFESKVLASGEKQVLSIEIEQKKEKSAHMTSVCPALKKQVIKNGGNVRPEISENENQAWVETQVPDLQVKNDGLKVEGVNYLDAAMNNASAAEPLGTGDGPLTTVEWSFYKIPVQSKNGIYGVNWSASYKNLTQNSLSIVTTTAKSKVKVHTPVVCQAECSDEKEWNQQIEPNAEKSLVLGRTFTLSIQAKGQHLTIPGYGNRDYSNYVNYYQVKFPFPVYYKEQYIKAGQWVNLKKGETEFYLPQIVDEKDYSIETRVIAVNGQEDGALDGKIQESANTNPDYYGASQTVNVTVVGRLYGFSLIDIMDYPRWLSVFRKKDGVTLSGVSYRSGTSDENGEPVLKNTMFTLPIINGSHPYNKKIQGIGLGYQVRFQVFTTGNFTSKSAYVGIQPTFYYVETIGGSKQLVDLYYKQDKEHGFVKIGSKEDLCQVKELNGFPVYSYGRIILSSACRSFSGTMEKNGESQKAAKESVQKWEGAYSLPAQIYVVKKGVDLTTAAKAQGGTIRGTEDLFLKNGYIYVHLGIVAVENGQKKLSYENPQNEALGYCNMWKVEQFQTRKQDLSRREYDFSYGEVFIFDVKNNCWKDYLNMGTH